MATILLTALASGTGSVVPGLVAGLIGGFLDSTFIIPALFPKPDVKGPKLGDLTLQSNVEGGPVSFCLGNEALTGGQTIYVSDLINNNNTYSVNVAIAWCMNEVDGIPEIFADGQSLYKEVDDADNTSTGTAGVQNFSSLYNTEFAAVKHMEALRVLVLDSTFGSTTLESDLVYIISLDLDEMDFRDYVAGTDVTITGYTDPKNNGTFTPFRTITDASAGISLLMFRNPTFGSTVDPMNIPDPVDGPLGGEQTLNAIQIVQTPPYFSANAVTSVTHYLGTSTQTEDPTLLAALGASNTTAFRGVVYSVLQGLQLNPFGNRIPSVEALINEDTTTVAVAITKLCARAGIVAGSIDVSAISGAFRGLTIRGAQPVGQQLANVMIAYNIVAQETNAKIVFRHRDALDTVVVADVDRGAYELGDEVPPLLQLMDEEGVKAPKTVVFTYLDPDRQYESSTIREHRSGTATDHVAFVDLPLVLSSTQARCINKRLLWQSHIARQKAVANLPPSYKYVQENDIVQISAPDGGTVDILASTVDIGDNGLVVVRGAIESGAAQTYDEADCGVDASPNQAPGIEAIAGTTVHVLNMPPFSYEQATGAPGYSLTFHQVATDDPNPDATLYSALQGTPALAEVGPIVNNQPVGQAQTVLADIGSVNIWDNVSTVEVSVFQGELESRTPFEVLSGLNQAMLGNELVGYTTATFTTIDLTGGRRYSLSGFLRGRNDTAYHTGGHQIGERFITLGGAGLNFYTFAITSLGATYAFKAVPLGGDVADYPITEFIYGDASLKPFSPGPVRHVRASDDSIFATIYRRSRYPIRILADMAIPILEPALLWEVDVLDGLGGSVVATYPSLGSGPEWSLSTPDQPIFVYSATDQTSDGLTPGDPVYLVFYQISDSVGRGNPLTTTSP